MAATASNRHKHIRIDQAKLDKAKRVLAASGTPSSNDVLIALSARSIGATIVTQNEGHFRAIQAVSPFQLVVVR